MVDISRHLEKADEAVRKKNFRFALDLYHQLLDLKPDHEEARRGLHQALDRLAAYRKGGSFLSFLSTLAPRMGALLSRLGRNPAGEARAWERVLASDPVNRRALAALGAALERARYLRSARVVYERLASLCPEAAEPWKRVGEILRDLGDNDGALAAFEHALAADPRDQEALRARKNLAAEGVLARSRFVSAQSTQELVKDQERARELERSQRLVQTDAQRQSELTALEDKLAGSPGDPTLNLRKAQVLRRLGRSAEARTLLEGLKAKGEAGFEARRLLGDILLAALEEELARGGGGSPAELARIQAEIGRVRLEVARDLVQANPTDLGLRFRLGEALQDGGRTDEAVAEFQQALKDPRFKVEALIRLARAFRAKGLADLAESQYSKALESLGPQSEKAREVLYELGDLLEERGQREEALGMFSRILEVDITYRDVSQRIDRLNRPRTG